MTTLPHRHEGLLKVEDILAKAGIALLQVAEQELQSPDTPPEEPPASAANPVPKPNPVPTLPASEAASLPNAT